MLGASQPLATTRESSSQADAIGRVQKNNFIGQRDGGQRKGTAASSFASNNQSGTSTLMTTQFNGIRAGTAATSGNMSFGLGGNGLSNLNFQIPGKSSQANRGQSQGNQGFVNPFN